MSKITFTNLPPAQGCASPSSELVLPQIDHNYTVGVIYVYIRIDCQSSILSHMVPELYNQYFNLLELQRLHRKIHRSRTVQIHHSLVAGSVPRSWLNFFERTKKKRGKNNAKKLSQLHAVEPARCAVIIPANTYYVFLFWLSHSFASSTWRSWLNFLESFFRFFSFQKIESAIELERCVWASAVLLR